MLDIRFVRENPEAVKENIRKKFQDDKLPLVDEVLDLDAKLRAAIQEADELPLKPWLPTLKYNYVEITPEEISGRRFQLGEEPERY